MNIGMCVCVFAMCVFCYCPNSYINYSYVYYFAQEEEDKEHISCSSYGIPPDLLWNEHTRMRGPIFTSFGILYIPFVRLKNQNLSVFRCVFESVFVCLYAREWVFFFVSIFTALSTLNSTQHTCRCKNLSVDLFRVARFTFNTRKCQ